MKKRVIMAAALLGIVGSICGTALGSPSDGDCLVLGYHQPNTNIYDGPTRCGEVQLSSLTVRGPLQLTKTKVTGVTDVSGPVKAIGSNLHGLVMQNNLSKEVVTLQSATQISGNITFKGVPGVVYLEDGSTVNGKVINGKIIKK